MGCANPKNSTQERPQRFCLNCNNQHGCRTAQSVCQSLAREPSQRYLSGKILMAKHGRLAECRDCQLFRRCWTAEEYAQALNKEELDP